jgi:putative tricarboxylic transport membrane protein
VHLLRIPFPVLAAVILVFSTIGAYALRDNIIDVYTMFIAGIAGYILRRSGYSMPGIVMGVVLGQLGENSFAQSMVILDYRFLGFFDEWVSGLLVTAGLLTVFWSIIRHLRLFRRNSAIAAVA